MSAADKLVGWLPVADVSVGAARFADESVGVLGLGAYIDVIPVSNWSPNSRAGVKFIEISVRILG